MCEQGGGDASDSGEAVSWVQGDLRSHTYVNNGAAQDGLLKTPGSERSAQIDRLRTPGSECFPIVPLSLTPACL